MINCRVYKAAHILGGYAEVQCGKCNVKSGKNFKRHWE